VPESLTQDSPTQFLCFQYPGVWPVLARRNHRVRVRCVFTHVRFARQRSCVVLTRQRSLLPPATRGQFCPLRGYCDGVSGSCICLNSSAAGFFGGPSCAVCDPWYSSVRCPGLTNRCSAHGTVAASAVTVAPTARHARCPGSGSPCTGHGVCSAITSACTCRYNTSVLLDGCRLRHLCDRLIWATVQPVVCLRTSASSARGHGLCADAARAPAPLGTAARRAQNPDSSCLSCAAGHFDPALLRRRMPRRCSGNGAVQPGHRRRRQVRLRVGQHRPGVRRHLRRRLVSPCQGHGTCDAAMNGRCIRDPYYGLADCSTLFVSALHSTRAPATLRASPAARTSPNASASSGVAQSADGSGICRRGLATPRGRVRPRQRHGACNAAHSAGVWVGATCNACAPGYVGANCDLQCATTRRR
jgi:hypothetical protein